MAITFPRAMPTEGIADQKFEAPTVDFLAPELGGRVGAVSAGFPLWRMDLTLGDMSNEDADAWRAFLRSLRGSKRTFYAWDMLRPYPKAYPGGFAGLNRAGGGAFPSDGAPTSWSVNTPRDILTLNGLPAEFSFGLGDLVGFVWSTDRRTVTSVVEAATASGGGTVSFSIEPALPPLVPADAAITLQRPQTVMRVITDATDAGPEDGISTKGGRLSAIQDLRA